MPLPTRRSLAVLLGLALTGLPGCGALSALGDATTPLDVYELRAPSGLPTATRTRPLQVTVEVPTTGGALQTGQRIGSALGTAAGVTAYTVVATSYDAAAGLRAALVVAALMVAASLAVAVRSLRAPRGSA